MLHTIPSICIRLNKWQLFFSKRPILMYMNVHAFFPHSLLILLIIFPQATRNASLPAQPPTPMIFMSIPHVSDGVQCFPPWPCSSCCCAVLKNVLTLLLSKYNLSSTWFPFLYFHTPYILQGMHQPSQRWIIVKMTCNQVTYWHFHLYLEKRSLILGVIPEWTL